MLDLSKAELDLKCPKCNTKIPFTLGQVQRGEKIVCAGCGINVVISDNGTVEEAQKNINDSLNKLATDIKSINAKIRI